MKVTSSCLPSCVCSVLLALSAGVMFVPQEADAANRIANASGNWNASGIWTGGADMPGQTQNDGVFIRGGRVITVNSNVIDFSPNPFFGISSIVLGETGANGTLAIESGAVLTTEGNLEVVRAGNFDNTTGTVNMSGGTLTVGGSLLFGGGSTNDNAVANFNISGGTLSTGATVVGWTAVDKTVGNYNVTGNAATVSGTTLTINEFGSLGFTLNSSGISTLNYSGAATFATNSTLSINGAAYTGGSNVFTLVNAASLIGSLDAINDSITGFDAALYTATLEFDSVNGDVLLNVAAIPEPRAYLLIGIGALLVVMFRRRLA